MSKKAFSDGIYGGILKPVTCYCHHFTIDMKHCVSNGLGPETAKKCQGVMWGSITSPTSLSCGLPRDGMKNHAQCCAGRCPFIKAGEACPYTSPEGNGSSGCHGTCCKK